MARPQKLSNFSKSYRSLFLKALDKPVKILCLDEAGANRARQALYSYRLSLLTEARTERDRKLAHDSTELGFSITLENGSTYLIVSRKPPSAKTILEDHFNA